MYLSNAVSLPRALRKSYHFLAASKENENSTYTSCIVDGKGMFLLILFSLLQGSSHGNFRHLLRYEAGDFS